MVTSTLNVKDDPVGAVPVDDDLFRQLVDHEPPDPNGGRREWSDGEAFVSFLRLRLREFAQVAVDEDPTVRGQFRELARARAQRAQIWGERVPRRPPASRVDKQVKQAKLPSRFWAEVGPFIVAAVGVGIMIALLLLDDRYPQRGFSRALGAAWVIIPAVVTICVLIAKDWRQQLRASRRDSDDPPRHHED